MLRTIAPSRWGPVEKQKRQRNKPLPPRKFADWLSLELLRELHIDETPSGVVEEVRIIGAVTTETEGLRRILAENVIAAKGDCSAVQATLPGWQAVVLASAAADSVASHLARRHVFPSFEYQPRAGFPTGLRS